MRSRLLGRCFIHPLFDYFVIGGGLSLLVTLGLSAQPGAARSDLDSLLRVLFVFSNFAHFAASTVRLYTKPGPRNEHPFLKMGFPLAAIVGATVSIAYVAHFGALLNLTFLAWSPFHYSAQAYGLAVMYCYRSSYELLDGEKLALRGCCLFPFLRNIVSAFVPLFLPPALRADPALRETIRVASEVLAILTWSAPVALYAAAWLRHRAPMPLIAPLLALTNGVWWIVTPDYLNAFEWATVFHGIQYIAIVLIFHAAERARRSPETPASFVHALSFYALCVPLGYVLFQVWPYAYIWMGFGQVESILLVAAVVNIHHFVVDAYIWRLRKDPNYQVVTSGG